MFNKAAVVIVWVMGVPCAALAQEPDTTERAVRGRDVPLEVRAAFRRLYPRATVRGFSTEIKDGVSVYEVESRDRGVLRDVTFSEAGVLLTIEESVPLAALPDSVRTAITTLARRAPIVRSERIIAGADTTYEFEIRGRTGEVKLTSAGRPVPNP